MINEILRITAIISLFVFIIVDGALWMVAMFIHYHNHPDRPKPWCRLLPGGGIVWYRKESK